MYIYARIEMYLERSNFERRENKKVSHLQQLIEKFITLSPKQTEYEQRETLHLLCDRVDTFRPKILWQ